MKFQFHGFPTSVLLLIFLLTSMIQINTYAEDTSVPLPTKPDETEGINLEFSPKVAEVGAPIELLVQLPAQLRWENIEVEFPEDQKRLFFVSKAVMDEPGRVELTVRGLKPGEYEVGPAQLSGTVGNDGQKQTIRIPFFKVEITGPTGEANLENLKGTTNPLGIPFDYTWKYLIIGTIVLVVLLILTILIILLILRRAKATGVAVEANIVLLPPVDEALSDLDALSTLNVYRTKGANLHYTGLSGIVRRYFERQYTFNAMELTDDELSEELVHGKLSNVEDSEVLPEILNRTVMAKFANQPVTEDLASKDCETIRRFLKQEKVRLDNIPAQGSQSSSGQNTNEGAA